MFRAILLLPYDTTAGPKSVAVSTLAMLVRHSFYAKPLEKRQRVLRDQRRSIVPQDVEQCLCLEDERGVIDNLRPVCQSRRAEGMR